MSSPIHRVISVAAARGYGTAVSLVTLVISARYLGPDGRGVFVAAIAWMSTFCTLFHLSAGPALQYRVQRNGAAYTGPAMLGTFMGLCVLTTTLAWAVATLSFLMTEGELFKGLEASILVLVFMTLPLQMWEQYSQNIYSSLHRMQLVNRAQYVGRTFGVALFAALVGYYQFGVIGALVSIFFTQLAIALLSLVPLARSFGWQFRWLAAELKPLLIAGAKLHPASISALLLDQASILIVNNYLSKSEVGLFQLAQQLVGLVLILPQSALLILYGGMAKSDPARDWPSQRRTIIKVMLSVIALAMLGGVLAPALIPRIVGEQFEPSIAMFWAMLPTLTGLSLSIMLTPQWLGRGLFMLSNSLTFAALVAVVAGSLWAVPTYGVDGAIAIRVAVYAVLLPLVYLAFWRWCNHQSAVICGNSAWTKV